MFDFLHSGLYNDTEVIVQYFLVTSRTSAVFMKAMKAVTGDASTHPSISTGLFEHPVGKKENILCCKTVYISNIYPFFVHVKMQGHKRAEYMEQKRRPNEGRCPGATRVLGQAR